MIWKSGVQRPNCLDFREISTEIQGLILQKVWTDTVIVQTFLRYYSMSDIFGLAYLVGQIED
jgi:hypothetical protein